MEKIQNREDATGMSVQVRTDACMDCIFWYQCRRGEIDCHLRPQRSIRNMVRA
ncbi:MAG TPA: hypothetical protein VK436_12625 [Methanocella sp.]|nr:hypothetical protein [Methanocella sp.]